jgi:hypothetical protein
MSKNNTSDQQRSVPAVPAYPSASAVCTRHGSSVNGEGQRQVYARNTFVTQDTQEKVTQYYSEQFGQPAQQSGSTCWQQETVNGNQHIMVKLTLESGQPGQTGQAAGQTLIKSYCVVTLNTQQANS